jgi:hypothetical protein
MHVTALRTLQTQLTALGFDPGGIDGRMGAGTLYAVAACLEALQPRTASDWHAWPPARQAVLCLQTVCLGSGLDPGALDGWWGPQTEYACGQLAHLHAHGELPEPWRDRYSTPANPNDWPLEREGALNAFYGKPGRGLVLLDLPYAMKLSWDTATVVTRTQCNARVKDSLARVLAKVRRHYGLAGIAELRLDRYGGGYNLREKRGGSTLSTHAWGIAFDLDPERNKLQWSHEHAAFARPEYEAWWRCWEAEGWVSLGRARNYDWMHVQAARV